MRKMLQCALALAVALAVFLAPVVASAAGQNMATLVISNPSLDLGGASVDIQAQATISAGMDEQNQRGFLTFSVDGNGTNALQALMAMEDGKVKGYMQSGSKALPYLLEIPMSELASYAGTNFGAAGEQYAAYGEFMAAVQAYGAKMDDPAYAAEMGQKVSEAVAKYMKLTPGDAEEIEIFGEKVTATKITTQVTLKDILAMSDEIISADPDLKALVDQYFKLLGMASGEEMSFSGILDMMKEQNVDAVYDITLWTNDEYTRVNEFVTFTEDGKDAGTMDFTFDVKTAGEDARMAYNFKVNMPDEKPVEVTLDINATTADDATKKFDMNMAASQDGAELFTMTVSGDEATAADGAKTLNLNIAANQEGAEVFSMTAKGGESTKDGALNKTLDVTFKSPEGSGTFTYAGENAEATATAKATDKTDLTLNMDSSGTKVVLGVSYAGEHYEQDGQTIYDGDMKITGGDGTTVYGLSFGTTLTLGTMPDGELLTDGGVGTLDPLTATAEQQAQLAQSAQDILTNAMGVMMQVPGIGMLFGSTMAS